MARIPARKTKEDEKNGKFVKNIYHYRLRVFFCSPCPHDFVFYYPVERLHIIYSSISASCSSIFSQKKHAMEKLRQQTLHSLITSMQVPRPSIHPYRGR